MDVETGRILRNPNLDQDKVVLRRALLANQLRLQSAQVRDNSELLGRLARIGATLDEYDTLLEDRSAATLPAGEAETESFDTVLSDLELQVKSLYDDEERNFFLALNRTLRTNQTLQTLLLALSALVVISGGTLAVSLRGTVGALRKEMLQRDKAETHLLEANEQLVRSKKLAAIGQLCGGVAHDLRNPLGAMKNATYLLNKRLSSEGGVNSNPDLGKYLDIVNQQIDRSNRIITDLLTFARVGPTSMSETHLEKVLAATLETLVKNDNIELSQYLDPNLCPVMADGEQLERVFLNLANNAQEAMPDGGLLTITARRVSDNVEVAVTDTGEGISVENIDKIFDPLFTTKNTGTGLGLAVCQEIVLRHGGKISARRNEEPSKGTTFEVILPVADSQQQLGEPALVQ